MINVTVEKFLKCFLWTLDEKGYIMSVSEASSVSVCLQVKGKGTYFVRSFKGSWSLPRERYEVTKDWTQWGGYEG
jgi:predicted NUDIX family NTP pyrophosphohydrolase